MFSFTDFFALNPKLTHFTGLGNYIQIFQDEDYLKAFVNTIKFVVIIVPLQGIGALVLALLINKVTRCKTYFKVAFFIPVVMSLAVVSTLWIQIYSPEGILNSLLAHLGISAQPFINSAISGTSFHSFYECMAGNGLPDDNLPRRSAADQSGAL